MFGWKKKYNQLKEDHQKLLDDLQTAKGILHLELVKAKDELEKLRTGAQR